MTPEQRERVDRICHWYGRHPEFLMSREQWEKDCAALRAALASADDARRLRELLSRARPCVEYEAERQIAYEYVLRDIDAAMKGTP